MTESRTHDRVFLLNRLISRSISRAPQEHKPPLHSARELLEIFGKRQQLGYCVEFFDFEDDDDDDLKRIKANKGKNLVRANKVAFTDTTSATYVTMLVDYVDNSVRSFPVVDIENYQGRELSGSSDERGATAAHVVMRLPLNGAPDDGSYRCVVEAVPNVSRKNVETLLSRQLRRHAKAPVWTFSVTKSSSGKKPETAEYQYYPRFDLVADIGRTVGNSIGKVLSQLVFTKRSEKQNASQATEVSHEDVYADVELRISAKQGPDDPALLKQWALALKDIYEKRGFDTKMYFRHAGGGQFSGNVHAAVDGATDLLMCQREIVTLPGEPKRWSDVIQPEIRDAMIKILERDELWERAK